MKLIVQIPCYNEERLLAQTVRNIPRTIEGIDEVAILVIDDGSTDRTVEVANMSGVDHIVSFNKNKGLASAFIMGLDTSINLGADIIVNIDADGSISTEKSVISIWKGNMADDFRKNFNLGNMVADDCTVEKIHLLPR